MVRKEVGWYSSPFAVYIENDLKLVAVAPNGPQGWQYGIGCACGLMLSVDFGHLDTVAPTAIPAGSISKAAFTNRVDLQWPAASDNANGTGVHRYELYRNGNFIGSTTGLSYSDTAGIIPNTTYNYTLKVVDYHLNEAATNFTVNTPLLPTNPPYPSATPEGRRTGVRPTGAY